MLVKKVVGFTLIELMIVIVILGILAATAISHFFDQTSNARLASLNALVASINNASAVVQAQYQVQAISTATSVDVNGVSVDVAAGTGFPTVVGIKNVISAMSGFTYNDANGQFDFSPIAVSNCFVTYSPSAGYATATTSGC